MAPGVAKTFIKKVYEVLGIRHIEANRGNQLEIKGKLTNNGVKQKLKEIRKENRLILNKLDTVKELLKTSYMIDLTDDEIDTIVKLALSLTESDTYQAMEAVVHNLNSMNSRAGSQVPFSSLNYGTDTSEEGRMVIKSILQATEAGLGNGETAIFPISIFKIKEGINYNEGDPNYDLFKYSMKVSAKQLFPNYVFIDAPFNIKYYKPGHIETEIASMGCVESSEIIQYYIDDEQYTEPFAVAYNRIKHCCINTKTSGNTEYIDTSGFNIKIADSYTGEPVKVLKFIRNKNVNNWRTLKFSDGYSITLTGDHPLPINERGRTYVDDAKIGEHVNISTFSIDSKDAFDTEYFGTDAWLLGLLITDASYSSAIVISLGMDEYDIVDKVKESADRLGYNIRIKEQHRGEKGDYVDVSITGINRLKYAKDELATLFGAFKKSERYITNKLLTMPIEYRRQLLAGLMDGDGYTSCIKGSEHPRSASMVLGSTNKMLALTELALIRSLGLKAKLYLNKYSSRHDKIRYLIVFEISDDIIKYMASGKKIIKAETIDRWEFSDISNVEIAEIIDGCPENENSQFSYDVETVSDRFDVSFIQSHNCRTRVIGNTYDPDREIVTGRGNLSFTSINLPRLAIEANNGVVGAGNINKFYELLDEMLELVHKQLYDRYKVQCRKHKRNYPFLMGQGVWIDSDKVGMDEDISEILRHGTLAVGFIGLAETLTMLIGAHHGESEEAQKLGLEIVGHMREMTDKWSEEEKMNYGVLATPAEGLSGRFVRIDQRKYGKIPGVTDKKYYTNSNHIPVDFEISAFEKIKLEAPYHKFENGGHICYVELDGDTTKNLEAFEAVIRCMHDEGVGYGAINHPVDRDPVCGYIGIIGDVCPRCGRRDGEELTPEKYREIREKFSSIDNRLAHKDIFEDFSTQDNILKFKR